VNLCRSDESLYDESGEPFPAYHQDEWVEWLSFETGLFERRSLARTWFLANGEKLLPVSGDTFLGLLSGKRYYLAPAAARAQGAE